MNYQTFTHRNLKCMHFREIVEWKQSDIKWKQDNGVWISEREKGFLDGLVLALPYTTDEPKVVEKMIYVDKFVYRTKIQTVAVERPVIKRVIQYASRNTDKEYCFRIEELANTDMKCMVYIFITKKARHAFLFSIWDRRATVKTTHWNEPISLHVLEQFTTFISTYKAIHA